MKVAGGGGCRAGTLHLASGLSLGAEQQGAGEASQPALASDPCRGEPAPWFSPGPPKMSPHEPGRLVLQVSEKERVRSVHHWPKVMLLLSAYKPPWKMTSSLLVLKHKDGDVFSMISGH